ncbi:MAG: hypothetical protein ACP5O4_02650 [bacterium]|jgi:hypothetical protein
MVVGGGEWAYMLEYKVGEKTSLEKTANKMGIKIIDAHVPDVIDKKQVFEEGSVWCKKDNVILTVGDNPNMAILCNIETLDNCYIYKFNPKELLGVRYKNLIEDYTIKGALTGMLTGAFVDTLVGTTIGILINKDINKQKIIYFN